MRSDVRPGQTTSDRSPDEWASNRVTPVLAAALLLVGSGGILALILVNIAAGNMVEGAGALIGAIGLCGILLFVAAVAVRRIVQRLGERVTVDSDGIHYRTLHGSTDLAWADIVAVRIRVAFVQVPSNRRFAPRVLQRIPKSSLDILYRGELTEQRERVLRQVALPNPAPNGFTHSIGIVEVHLSATDDPDAYATPLQLLLRRIAPTKYLGTTVDPG
jgi:hypothetical protein